MQFKGFKFKTSETTVLNLHCLFPYKNYIPVTVNFFLTIINLNSYIVKFYDF